MEMTVERSLTRKRRGREESFSQKKQSLISLSLSHSSLICFVILIFLRGLVGKGLLKGDRPDDRLQPVIDPPRRVHYTCTHVTCRQDHLVKLD